MKINKVFSSGRFHALKSFLPEGSLVVSVLVMLSSAIARAETPGPHPSSSGSAGLHSPMSLRLSWCDGNKLLPRGYETMSKEVKVIFEAVGIDVSWTRAEGGAPRRDARNIMVVLMPNQPTGWGLPSHVMGVAVGKGEKQRSVFIFFPSLLRVMGRKGHHNPSAREIHELAVALGRVIAHEVVHVIAPAAPHTDRGLMNGWLKRKSLRQRRLDMIPSTAAIVCASLESKPPMRFDTSDGN
jgi:hypothetical protein